MPHQGKKDWTKPRGQAQMSQNSMMAHNQYPGMEAAKEGASNNGGGQRPSHRGMSKGAGATHHGQKSMSITNDPAQVSQSGTNQSPDAIVSPKGMYPSHSMLTSNVEHIDEIEGQIENSNGRSKDRNLDNFDSMMDPRNL